MHTYTRRRPEARLIEGVKNLCRLCLEKSEDIMPIFLDGSDGICATLALRIMICVGLQVTREESLPNIICSDCNKELDRYYKFRKKCEVSYQRLKLHLQAIKDKGSLHKAVEERDLKQEKIMKDNVNCIEKVCDDNKFCNLDVNGLTNIDAVNSDISIEVKENCNVNTEEANHMESKEIETQIHDADNPEISSFLSTVLIQLGILDQQDSTLSILDPGINNLELVMGDDELVTLELAEEDDDSSEEKQNITNGRIKPIVLNSTAGDSSRNGSNDTACDNVEEQVMTIKWKPEPVLDPGVGNGGAWCGICHKWFATRSTLRRHLRVHTGERPYPCRDCGRRFAQRAVLDRHRLVHLERRPFVCEECGKSFTQRSALHSHARAHAPPHARALHLHACTTCPKVFLSSSSLSRHIMMHKGRLYGCTACPRQFRDKSSLLRHLRSTHAQRASQTLGIQTYEPPSPETQQHSPETQQPSPRTQPLSGETDQLSLETQTLQSNTQQHSPRIEPVILKIQPPSLKTQQHSPESQPDSGNVTG